METSNDIVRDIRSRNEGVPLDGESSHCLAEDMLRLADRIEAAHKREVAVSKMETTTPTCEKSSQVGNAAAMREALEEILDETNRSVYCIDHIRCLAESALAAPPRNCDRFYSFEEAQKRFLRETGSLIVAEDILDWLFAEAKGKE